MPRRLVAALLAVAAWTTPAAAADLPVSYLVEEKPLRAARSGDALLFELHTNASCTALVHTEVVPIESVDLLSRLKLLMPKGADKRPKTVELRHVLTGVAPQAALYLRVIGPRITASGSLCQVQSSAIAGPPGAQGPPGAPGAAGPAPLIKDANGTTVGVLAPFGNNFQILRNVGDKTVGIRMTLTSLVGSDGAFYYTSSNCSGQRLMATESQFTDGLSSFLYTVTTVRDGMLYYAPGVGAMMNTQSRDFEDSGCQMHTSTGLFAPPVSVDVSGFVAPFRVVIE